jgi:hypothetical protein
MNGQRKMNNECRKTIVVGKLFIWVIYRDQRNRTILGESNAYRNNG